MHVVKIVVTIMLCAAVCLPGNRVFMEEIPDFDNDWLRTAPAAVAEIPDGDGDAPGTEPATDPEGGYDPTGGASSNS